MENPHLTLTSTLTGAVAPVDGPDDCVKHLQEEYNTYYTDKSRKYMLKLDKKSVEI